MENTLYKIIYFNDATHKEDSFTIKTIEELEGCVKTLNQPYYKNVRLVKEIIKTEVIQYIDFETLI
jgi:hypothetical protein